jgi:hypothetical protein
LLLASSETIMFINLSAPLIAPETPNFRWLRCQSYWKYSKDLRGYFNFLCWMLNLDFVDKVTLDLRKSIKMQV